jgi:hypothetical protein
MTLAVIGSGFGRTGTMSLKLALEQLGFGPCHHMEEVLKHPPQVAYWQAVAAGRPVNWGDVFQGYRSQVDWPGAHVWRELAVAFPEAKVIHSQRPEEAWWTSFSDTIGTLFATYHEAPLPPHVKAMMDAAAEMIVNQTLGGKVADREGALCAYRSRGEQVRSAIPADRLLVFEASQGWEPLCRFLDVPVPTTPFPRANNTHEFWELVRGAGNA